MLVARMRSGNGLAWRRRSSRRARPVTQHLGHARRGRDEERHAVKAPPDKLVRAKQPFETLGAPLGAELAQAKLIVMDGAVDVSQLDRHRPRP